jgi:light-regulated signal transduction histidine kinase (bacteriophytochrome)
MGSALPARDADGKIVKWFGSCTDIDDQKRIEEELRRSNQDLEQFAYSASHDIQEPLRTIKIYGELLTQRYGAQVDAQALEFLRYMRESASRMEILVHDLLAYTQITKVDFPEEDSDANVALTEALANLSGAIAESRAAVTYDRLPSPRVNSTHLRQLFQNLVGNAISADREAESWVFKVRDNGMGIGAEYQQQIFGLFKRLHTTQAYSGTGIGLAICQRIVERYRGRIWVESEEGRGSTFFFSLPAS